MTLSSAIASSMKHLKPTQRYYWAPRNTEDILDTIQVFSLVNNGLQNHAWDLLVNLNDEYL
jgi:hypothetical protein